MRSRLAPWLPMLTATVIGMVPVAQAAPSPAQSALDPRFGVVQGFQNPAVMADLGAAGFERIMFDWSGIEPNGPNDFDSHAFGLSKSAIQAEVSRGETIAGDFQFTPSWAAQNPSDGGRAVPKNIDLPFDDPNNYFGQYVYKTALYYKGIINNWIIWNEPEFKPDDVGAGGSFTWLGTDEQFAQLLKVAYLAVKKADPTATVSFPGSSYWVDELAIPKRPQFYDRILSIFASDPNAAAKNYYHDVLSLNLYQSPDNVYRVYGAFKNIQKQHGLDKPIWLTETNAAPTDDAATGCTLAPDLAPTTMEQQSAFAIQAFAIGAAAGYGRLELFDMVDGDCSPTGPPGLTRNDGSKRPVEDALRVAMRSFSGFTSAQFVPLVRDTAAWSAWPDDPSSYFPNDQVYQVALDKPGNQRVTVLWNADGTALRARIPSHGTNAYALDKHGNQTPLQANQGWWVVDLPAATAAFDLSDTLRDPPGYYYIGGDPVLIVEDGVPTGTSVVPPSLGDPDGVARGFKMFVDPSGGQTVASGQPADFQVSARGYEGFSDPLSLSVLQWSTQRVPTPQDPGSLPLPATFPPSVAPGGAADVHLETAGAEPGIYYVTMQATGGGLSDTFELDLVVN